MNKNLLVAIVVLLLAGGFLFVATVTRKQAPQKPTPTPAPTVTPTPSPIQLLVPLSKEHGSTESGVATLTEQNGTVTVSLAMTGESAGVTQPAHIHVGKCPTVGAVKYPLTDVVAGTSQTTLTGVTSINQLLSQLPLAINVHKSTAAPSVYVSCGDILSPNATPSGALTPSVTGMVHQGTSTNGATLKGSPTTKVTPNTKL